MNALLPLGLLAAGLIAAPGHDSKPDIVDVASKAGQFETLLAAADAAGLVDALRGDGPLTVLAPTDEAFAKLGKDTIASLLQPENKKTLQDILLYHVVSGEFAAADVIKAGKANALNGDALTFGINGGRLTVNGKVNVVANDVGASNGVIHVIDQVLIPQPDAPEGRLVVGFYSERPGKELADYFGLDRNECLLVERVTKGGEAAKAGLKPFDLIVGVGDRPATKEILEEAKAAAGYQGQIKLYVLRRGEKLLIEAGVGIEKH